MSWSRYLILASLLFFLVISPVYSLTEPVQLNYPPLNSIPSDMLVDKDGYIWVTLPMEKSVCRFDIASESLRIVNLPIMTTRIIKAADKLVAYQRGVEKIFIIDPSQAKIDASIDLPYPIENAWSSSRGLWTTFTGSHGLFLIGIDGTIIKKYKIEIVDFELALSEYDTVIWYINSDGKSISRLDTMTDVIKNIRIDKLIYAVLAASLEEAWIITSDGSLSLISINSEIPIKTFSPKSGIVGINRMYLIDKDRVVFVNAASGVVGEIDGNQLTEQPLGENQPTLSDMFRKSKLYFIDVKKNSLGFVVVSTPPEITFVSSFIKNEYEILVEATIKDREADFKDGYPRLKVIQGNKELASIPMVKIAGDKFTSSITVNNIDGKISIILEAKDWGDNFVKSNVGTYSVKNGKIVTGEATTTMLTTTQTTTTTSEIDIGQIMMLTLELVLLVSLLAALFVIIRRKPGRTRKTKRLK